MKTIAIFDDKNYNNGAHRLIREAVRAIIVRNGKVAMIKSLREFHYKFPGGGMEENETQKDTLLREVLEETGLVVKPDSLVECGMIEEIRKSLFTEDIFDQKSSYYFAEIEDVVHHTNLTNKEKELQYVLEWVEPIKAYEIDMEMSKHANSKFLLREATILKMIL